MDIFELAIKFDKRLNKSAAKYMLSWNLRGFKVNFNRLYRTIFDIFREDQNRIKELENACQAVILTIKKKKDYEILINGLEVLLNAEKTTKDA